MEETEALNVMIDVSLKVRLETVARWFSTSQRAIVSEALLAYLDEKEYEYLRRRREERERSEQLGMIELMRSAPDQLGRGDLDTMTSEEIVAAKEAGRLFVILNEGIDWEEIVWSDTD